MLITLSGIHGLGKTTMVNKLELMMPMIKIVDSDILVEHVDDPIDNQLRRILVYKSILTCVAVIPSSIPIIVDRSPLDFYAYLEATCDKLDPQYEFCKRQIDFLVSYWKTLDPINLLLFPFNKSVVKNNIITRNRKTIQYELETLDLLYDMFYNNSGLYFDALCGHESKKVDKNIAPKVIERIIDEASEFGFTLPWK